MKIFYIILFSSFFGLFAQLDSTEWMEFEGYKYKQLPDKVSRVYFTETGDSLLVAGNNAFWILNDRGQVLKKVETDSVIGTGTSISRDLKTYCLYTKVPGYESRDFYTCTFYKVKNDSLVSRYGNHGIVKPLYDQTIRYDDIHYEYDLKRKTVFTSMDYFRIVYQAGAESSNRKDSDIILSPDMNYLFRKEKNKKSSSNDLHEALKKEKSVSLVDLRKEKKNEGSAVLDTLWGEETRRGGREEEEEGEEEEEKKKKKKAEET
mgnify:CR=1 FL=1